MNRRRVTASIVAACLVAAGAVAVPVWLTARPVAVIGGVPVSHDELDRYRSLAADGAFHATTESALLDRIALDRALFQLADHAHLTDGYRSLDQVLDQRTAVNRAQTVGAQQGRVVYGDTDYDAASFYGRVVAQLRSATARALSSGTHPDLSITDAQVDAAYDADPAAWAAAATTYHCTTVTVPDLVDGVSGDQVLDRIAADPAAIASAARTISGAVVGSRDIAAPDLPVSGLDPDAQAALPTLADGTTLPPQTAHGSWVLYRLDATSVDRTQALDTYRTQIRQQLIDRRFTRLLDTTATRLRHDDS